MRDRVARGVAWAAATRVLVNLLSLASTLALARLLTPDDFGLVAIAMTVSVMVTSLTELSLAQALVQHPDPREGHFHTAWTLNVARGAVLAPLLCALAHPIALAYGDLRLVPLMFAIAGSTFLISVVNPKLVVFARSLVFWQDFVLTVSQRFIGFVFAIAIAVIYSSYWALIVGMIASQVVVIVISYALISYRPKFDLSRLRELFSFSAWLTLAQAVNTLNWRSDELLVGYFLGNSALGYYNFGNRIALLPTQEATAPLAATLFPAFCRINDDLERLRGAYRRAQALLLWVALPMGFGFALVADPLVLLTVGEKWRPAVPALQILSGVFAVQMLAQTLQPLAMALGRTKRLFYRDATNLVIRLPLLAAGALLGGLMGVLYARCVSGLTGTLLNMLLVRNLLGLSLLEQLRNNARALASAALMVVVTTGVGELVGDGAGASFLLAKVAAMAAAGAFTYLSASFLLWMAARKPDGPEAEAVQAVSRLKARLLQGGDHGLAARSRAPAVES